LHDHSSQENSFNLSRAYTAIVPTTPSNPFIHETLQSIREQSLPPSRVLVIINGASSQDGNAATDARNCYPAAEIHHISEIGIIPAIRFALNLCTTGYVAFLDADDLWMPHKAQTQVRILEDDVLADVVYGGVQNFFGPSANPRYKSSPVVSRLFSACTFRMSAFTKNGPPAEDDHHFNYLYRWWIRAIQSDVQTRAQDETVLLRRVHQNNSWLTQSMSGMSVLFGELRRISSGPSN
jgi:cellulose synthase/poly-beta-1,6-N-acetylglucosamine synthase-like glycosyltransferase